MQKFVSDSDLFLLDGEFFFFFFHYISNFYLFISLESFKVLVSCVYVSPPEGSRLRSCMIHLSFACNKKSIRTLFI